MEKQTQRNKHIVLVPLPYQGHINPMLKLAKALHSNGFSITIAHTTHNSLNPDDHPDFAFFPMPDGLPDRQHTAPELVALMLAINDNCREIFRRFMEENEIDCVVSDEFMFFAEDIANGLKVPTLILRTTSAATTLARSLLIELTEGGHIPLRGHDSHELVHEIPPLRFKDMPFTVTNRFESFSVLITSAYTNRVSSAIIWNTMNCLEQEILDKIRQESKVPIFAIGPIHMIAPPISSSLIKEDNFCISWLDKQPPGSVLYVSCTGSIVSFSEQEVAEIAWGLANSQQPFLWVIRPGSIQGCDWTKLLPQGFRNEIGDRGCVVKWAPQNEVLAHGSVGGFWSHCGWNSTLEGMAQGVPMICRACFSDQRVNSRYLCHVWRIGLELEALERVEIERVIRRLMVDDDGKEMRARARECKGKFEASTRKGGSSFDSFNELVNFIKSL